MEKERRARRGFVVSPRGESTGVIFREIADPGVWVAEVPVSEAGTWRAYFDNESTDLSYQDGLREGYKKRVDEEIQMRDAPIQP